MAKLDGAKLKVEPPKACPVRLTAAAAAAGCGPNGEEIYDKPKVVNGEYRHDIGELNIRIKAENLAWGREELRRARINAPHITEDINKVADTVGARREGIGKEVKEEESFLRKQFVETENDTIPPASIKSKMNDSVRYTYIFEPEVYTNGVARLRTELAKRGYQPVELKNFWFRNQEGLEPGAPPRKGYPGINMTWESPEGQTFELQIHTPKGYQRKGEETQNYETRRVLEAAIEELKALAKKRELTRKEMTALETYQAQNTAAEAERAKIFGDVDPPPGAIDILQFPMKPPRS